MCFEYAGMLVLVAALGSQRSIAVDACYILHSMMACPKLPSKVVNYATETLLRYQAVPRLCIILQPEFAALPTPGADTLASKILSLAH